MAKLTLGKLRQAYNGAFAVAVGACASDIPTVASWANRVESQLLMEGGESGWWGGWQRFAFQLCPAYPYLTLPRNVARVINMAMCNNPWRIQNEFYEFLEAGPGLQDFYSNQGYLCQRNEGAFAAYERGNFVTNLDISSTNQYIAVVCTDPRDYQGGKRIMIGPCQDQNGNPIYSTDGANQVNGFYLTLASPMAVSPMIVTAIQGIQKDVTFGDILLYQMDATTGAQVLLSRYQPTETTPVYRRYYFNNMPANCNIGGLPGNACSNPSVPNYGATVTAMCRMEHVDVVADTDYLVLGNIDAMIEQAKSIRFSEMDSEKAPALEAKCHARAIKLLNAEMTKYLGRQQPAVNFAPFGTAKLSRPMSAVRWG